MGDGARWTRSRLLSLALLIGRLTSRGVLCAEASAPGDCEGPDGQCSANSAPSPPLRWRGFPYRVSDPAFARTVYGGDYVRAAFKEQGFVGPVEGDDWDVLWTHRPQDVKLPPRPGGRLVNHCTFFSGAGDKCGLARLTSELQALNPAPAGHRWFRTFELGRRSQWEEWTRLVRAEPERYWALKPCFGGASKGIKILRGQGAIDAAEAEYADQETVAQEYLEQPFLGFGGRKFHLRLYILVTRWEPVGAYLYDGGLVFRSLHPLSNQPGKRDVFSSISSNVEALPLAALWQHLDAAAAAAPPAGSDEGLSASIVRSRIIGLLREVLGTKVESARDKATKRLEDRGCFDLFGADVILDQELRPLLMELNSGPNMWISDHGEAHKDILATVKQPMVQQMVHWASLRLQRPPVQPGSEGTAGAADLASASAEEAKALLNFTQLL